MVEKCKWWYKHKSWYNNSLYRYYLLATSGHLKFHHFPRWPPTFQNGCHQTNAFEYLIFRRLQIWHFIIIWITYFLSVMLMDIWIRFSINTFKMVPNFPKWLPIITGNVLFTKIKPQKLVIHSIKDFWVWIHEYKVHLWHWQSD